MQDITSFAIWKVWTRVFQLEKAHSLSGNFNRPFCPAMMISRRGFPAAFQLRATCNIFQKFMQDRGNICNHPGDHTNQ